MLDLVQQHRPQCIEGYPLYNYWRQELTYFRTTFPQPCAMRANSLTKFYLFCDICEPMIVNTQRHNLLRMVVSDAGMATNPANQITFPLQYRKICKSLVTSIRIWMQEDLFLREEINIASDVGEM